MIQFLYKHGREIVNDKIYKEIIKNNLNNKQDV